MNDGESGKEFWVTPFELIVGVVDEKNSIAQVYEYHARGTCRGASAWVAYHYPRTSSIVTRAETDGSRNIFTVKLGKGELDLKPSVSPAGIESAIAADDELKLTYAGLAGGGVGISKCRSMAENIKNVEIEEAGGGSKLGRAVFTLPLMHKVHIGIDDTDTKESGATWALANELGFQAASSKGIYFLNHTIVQLYPHAPGKTKNCVSTVLTFAVRPMMKEKLVHFVRDQLHSHTESDDTGIAVMEGIDIPEKLKLYSDSCRTGIVELAETEKIADELKIQLYEITGKMGLIGALAGLGYTEQHGTAVKLVNE
jgi:methanogenesis imperfect marker protein 11